MKRFFSRRFPPLCLVCGVDSGPIRTFLLIFMGGFVLATMLLLLWAWGTRRVSFSENEASLPIEAEQKGS